MPQLTLSATTALDAAIAADAGRTFVEFSLNKRSSTRWCFGATFVAADSQPLKADMARPFEGKLAQQAFSFGPGSGYIDVTTL